MRESVAGHRACPGAGGVIPLPGADAVVARQDGHNGGIEVDEMRLIAAMRIMTGVASREGMGGMQIERPILEMGGGGWIRTGGVGVELMALEADLAHGMDLRTAIREDADI